MKKLITSALLLSAAIFTITSCKKKESSLSSEAQKLTTGKWQITKMTADWNGNHMIDSSDFSGTDSIWAFEYYQFNTNGTITATRSGTVFGTGTWQLLNNNTYLKTDTTGGGKASIEKIEFTNSDKFTLLDTGDNNYIWFEYSHM